MFRKKEKAQKQQLMNITASNLHSYYDLYRVAVVVDGVVEAVIPANLGLLCALLSNPTFKNATSIDYKIGDKIQ